MAEPVREQEVEAKFDRLQQPIWFSATEDTFYIPNIAAASSPDAARHTKIICTLGAHTSTVVRFKF